MQPVLIIGSGFIGATMAIALARAGIPVALVEAKKRSEQLTHAFDGRTLAIAAASVKILSAVGVWQRVKEACAITDIRVCDKGGQFHVHYDHRKAGDEPFGYMVEARLLREALFAAVDETAGITLHESCRLSAFETTSEALNATLDNGQRIDTPLMLLADGKLSQSRTMAGIDHRLWRYGQTAMVATIAHSKPHHGLALEAFYPAGPLAVLPMTQNRSNIVWTESEAMAQHLLALDADCFTQELHKRIGDYWGDLTLLGARHSYPLVLMKAQRYVTHRIALIGDAAHAIHPIAGQGVNLGFRDVAVLAEMLIAQARLGLNLGDANLLARYARRRKADVESMAIGTDMLNRLFSNDNKASLLARDLGLGLVERTPLLKSFFMKHAMGYGGNIPKMMRGEAV